MSGLGYCVFPGDCVETLRQLPDASVDAVVTDPPYGLSKEPDPVEVLWNWIHGADYQHTGAGFMGKTWDSFVPGPSVWREVLRVLKPGGHVLSFSGTRTYDLMVIAMRLAGFEIRDQLAWMYGTGFPKSLNVSKAIDKAAGAERPVVGHWHMPGRGTRSEEQKFGTTNDSGTITAPATAAAAQWDGWGTALKPAQEPIVLARKPLVGTVAANVLEHGTGALNIDASRIGMSEEDRERARVPQPVAGNATGVVGYMGGTGRNGETLEPPTGGRWPANVLLDPEAAAQLDAQTGELKSGSRAAGDHGLVGYHGSDGVHPMPELTGSSGGASRFFYCAKPSKAERERGLEHWPSDTVDDGRATPADNPRLRGKTQRKNIHPTVKPIELMRYLVRLITPPGGIVLDPYTGSGTTGIAAVLENMRFVGCELSPEYVAIAQARMEAWRNAG